MVIMVDIDNLIRMVDTETRVVAIVLMMMIMTGEMWVITIVMIMHDQNDDNNSKNIHISS